MENLTDDGARQIWIDVPNCHGKLDPHAFQDWLTSLDDYSERLGMLVEHKVRFVKMKLKGQAQVWLQSMEKQLHRTHQLSIYDYEEMWLKL